MKQPYIEVTFGKLEFDKLKDVRFEHFEKHSSIEVTFGKLELDKLKDVRFEHLKKAPYMFTVFSVLPLIVTCFKLVHPSNILRILFIFDDFTVALLIFEHPLNAPVA